YEPAWAHEDATGDPVRDLDRLLDRFGHRNAAAADVTAGDSRGEPAMNFLHACGQRGPGAAP
ncbi:PadR family transcriptional regulator, partial [Streptomyces sp. NPDC001177]